MTFTRAQAWEFLVGDGSMSVTSLLFLAYFAAVAVINYALPRVARPYFLLAAGLFYYAYTPENRPFLWVLLGMAALTWVCGLIIGKVKIPAVRIAALVLSIVGGCGLLVYYKYWNLLADSVGGTVMEHRSDLLAPLGLSYFTFAAMSYTIDVYKRRCRAEANPLHYAMFVSFFPTMLNGPIERYPHMRPQIQKSRRFSYTRCAGGAFRMLWGYTKKLVIAENLNLYISTVYNNLDEMSGPNLLAATVLFCVRLYMDFSGGCDIALGMARILGYDLIENFQSPFESRSFGEFWRRWHISMTGWFRDYVYFSLGGSRCAPWRHYLNVLIVFLCSGLWHGADWRYLAWGLACGVVSVLSLLTAKPREALARHNPLYRAAWFKTLWQVFCTDALFCLTVVFFASAIYNMDPFAVYAAMLNGWQGLAGSWVQISALLYSSGLDGRLPAVLVFASFVVFAAEHNGRNVAQWIRKQAWPLRWALYYGASAAILFFAAFGQSAFIYQNY